MKVLGIMQRHIFSFKLFKARPSKNQEQGFKDLKLEIGNRKIGTFISIGNNHREKCFYFK